MASPNTSWDEILTTTLYARSSEIADSVSNNNALLYRIKKGGGRKPFNGGVAILEHLAYQANSTVDSYSGYEQLDVTPVEVLTSAQYEIKQYAGSVSISGLEKIQNGGSKEQVIDLMEARLDNLETSLLNRIATDIYGDGTGNAGKNIGGLQLLVPDDPTSGTCGGISRSSYTFWRSYMFDSTTTGGAAATASNIQGYMNTVWLNLVRGTEKPDLIVADNNYYNLYLGSLQAIQRVTNESKMAAAGFEAIKYKSADVVFDGGLGGSCPSNHMYFLNTKYLKYRPHSKTEFVPLNPERHAVDQDATVKLMAWAGNLTCSCMKLQGVLKD